MNDQGIGVLGLGAYVPDRVMTNDDWTEFVDTSDEWITSRSGIKERRFAAADETSVDLAVAASRAALADAGLSATDIDEIIVATDTPEVFTPDTAAYVQHALGARNVAAYDLAGSGCAGFLMALDLAKCRAGDGRRVLVIAVELISRLMDWRRRETCVLFGDAAGAAIIGPLASGPKPVATLLAATAGTDGSKADILCVEAGGTRVPTTEETARQGLQNKIMMNGREVFKEAVRRMSQATHEVLERAGLRIEDLALLVPHQANARILAAIGRSLEIAPERVFSNIRLYGNTGSASVPLALTQARELGRIESGDLVMLVSFGAGFHWAAQLLEFR